MALLTYNQIKKKVGNAWALIYNPVYSDKTGKLLKGELKEFDSTEKNLIDIVSQDKNPKKYFTIVWFGKEPNEKLLLNFF
jgi:hypothetical protein